MTARKLIEPKKDTAPARVLRLVLGDQLDKHHSWFSCIDANHLYVVAELVQEQCYVRHHIQKSAAFFLAMDHFARDLRAEGHRFNRYDLDETAAFKDLPAFLEYLAEFHQVETIEYQLPDEHRLRDQLSVWAKRASRPVKAIESEHFYLTEAELHAYFKAGKAHRMEHFYRKMRVKFDVLMAGEAPVGGRWNFDQENRKRFPKAINLPEPLLFDNDIEAAVARLRRHNIETVGVEPQTLIWPVTTQQAERLLEDFCLRLLPNFGRYQDALTDRGWALFHARIAFALNIKLLRPRDVVEAVVDQLGRQVEGVDIAQVEGFVRQILGWREFIRGIYWANMPAYGHSNVLKADGRLPEFYWSGQTNMACMKQALQQSLEYAYAHHIQRLMVTGNFALLLGVDPREVDAWYLGIYIDAIEWVEMPNTRGMSQFADGGLVASKPYISSGKYIERMSDHCKTCRYDVNLRFGESACPFNVLYWDFLRKHEPRLRKNPRMRMMLSHYDKMASDERQLIATSADQLCQTLATK